MARKTTRSKTRQPKPPKPAPTGPRTTEDLADEDLQVLAFKHTQAFDALEEKRKALAKQAKEAKLLAKAEMGADALEVIDDLQQLRTDAGELKLTTAVRRILRSARWAGSKLGKQFEMFDQPDRTPAVDKAFEDGKRAGMAGEPCKPSYDPSTEQYRGWMAGWQEGQEALLRSKLKPDVPQGSQPADGESEDAEPGPPATRAEFKDGLAHNEQVANEIIKAGVIGDQPNTATVLQQ